MSVCVISCWPTQEADTEGVTALPDNPLTLPPLFPPSLPPPHPHPTTLHASTD